MTPRFTATSIEKDEGPLTLTAKGDRVLDEILELEGATLPPLVTEVAA